MHISFCEEENMKLLLLVLCGLPTKVLSAQSSLPRPNRQVYKAPCPHEETTFPRKGVMVSGTGIGARRSR